MIPGEEHSNLLPQESIPPDQLLNLIKCFDALGTILMHLTRPMAQQLTPLHPLIQEIEKNFKMFSVAMHELVKPLNLPPVTEIDTPKEEPSRIINPFK